MFYIGQKVVCIRDWPPHQHRRYLCPTKGSIYTVRALQDIGTAPSMYLVEIRNSPYVFINVPYPIEPAWIRSAFRPLVERKTDISLFTAMLDGAKHVVEA